VCTGNVCRSPLAERLMRSWAERAAVDPAALVLSSAGTDAAVGRPMDERSARSLSELGGDPAGAAGRALVAGEAEDADLVLTMTRRQRHVVLGTAPRAMRRTFTLPEAAALLGSADVAGVAELAPDRRARELAHRLHDARRCRQSGPADDVVDPIGHPLPVHQEMAAHVAGCLEPLAALLLAGAPSRLGR
jgi:protein-tyrosine phosphatase